MNRVFITRQFPQNIIKVLKDAGFIVEMWNSDNPVDYTYMMKQTKEVDGIICTVSDKINKNLIESAKNLKIISTMSVGYDHIDTVAARSKNIKIGYTPDVLTDATAELCVALLLSVSRKLTEGITAVKDGSWNAWKPFWMCGYGLKNSVVGIVGLGKIGQAIAKRLNPFSVKSIIACGSNQTKVPFQTEIDPDIIVQNVSFQQLIENSDFVIVSCAFNEKTRNLFNDSVFSKMKKNAIFINVSRGGVVDQDALYRALKEGMIAGAGLDVCTPEPLPVNHPLLEFSNCVILPHIGSATIESRNEMCRLATDNLIQGLRGEDMVAELKF